jgi:hypothetical protein
MSEEIDDGAGFLNYHLRDHRAATKKRRSELDSMTTLDRSPVPAALANPIRLK